MSRKNRPYEKWGAIVVPNSSRNEFVDDNMSSEKISGYGIDEVATCARFGCGRALSDREKLFGMYCIHHSEKPITRIL